jgi:hypothetical protein
MNNSQQQSENENDDDNSGENHMQSNYISTEQRKYLRECIESMILHLALIGQSEKELFPILDFLATCKNKTVLNEIAQVLLCLIVEGGSKIIASITTLTRGPEEFAAFTLFYLIHQAHEELRCNGIRLLTHYYLRLDSIPANLTSLTLKRRKESRLLNKLSISGSSGNNHGMKRLHVCGGLALLGEIMSSHYKASTELSYSALLEMLLTKPGLRSQVTVKNAEISSDHAVSVASTNIHANATSTEWFSNSKY